MRSDKRKNYHKMILLRWENDDGIGTPKQTSGGQESTAVTWTPLRLLIYHMSRHEVRVQDVKISLCLESTMDHSDETST